MDDFNFNVYETFGRIHQLLGNSEDPEDATAMDRAEYQLQHNKLVEGLVELLQHAAKHKILSLDIGDYDHDLEPSEIGVYRDEDDEPAANHTVAIRVPDEYVPDDDGVSEAIEAFNLPTVETTADLALAAMAHMRFVSNDVTELDERLFDAWASGRGPFTAARRSVRSTSRCGGAPARLRRAHERVIFSGQRLAR